MTVPADPWHSHIRRHNHASNTAHNRCFVCLACCTSVGVATSFCTITHNAPPPPDQLSQPPVPCCAHQVHLGAGAWGVVAVALFSMDKDHPLSQSGVSGIFYDSSSNDAWVRLGWQLLGLLVIMGCVHPPPPCFCKTQGRGCEQCVLPCGSSTVVTVPW